MATVQNELSPQFARLFFVAGLLEQSEWDNYGNRHQKHKPILDVLTQEVSLDSFRDLLFAELSLKRQGGAESSLHQGLTASGIVNDEELQHLLNACRPRIDDLLRPLVAQGQASAEAAQRAAESYGQASGNYAWAFAEGLISAQMVGQWLGRVEVPQMQLAALYLALDLLRHNQILGEKDFAHCLPLLAPEKLVDALSHARQKLGLTSRRVGEILEGRLTLPQAPPLGKAEVSPVLRAMFPQSFMRRQMIIPFEAGKERLGIITTDPLNITLVALLQWISGRWPQLSYAPGSAIIERLNSLDGPADGETEKGPGAATSRKAASPPLAAKQEVSEAETPARPPRRESDLVVDNMSAVQLVSSLIESAIEMQTTDIHIEPTRTGLLVRFRIDGELHRIMSIPPALAQSVISRVKVLADMDVTERRRPQDGHFELRVEKHNYDFRISSLPAIMGEKIVIRILDESRIQTGLEHLGLMPAQQKLLEGMLEQPHGLVLVTGPTGSGKTSTLYAALNMLNKENRNLVTIEDPVEYQLEGINQVQVDPHIGLTFSEGLRSILRQDPDVIMVGEVRDGDTAHNAIRAAMTGHLVFSTLHTNSALGAVDALVHLGASPFMVAGSLIGILSQRLLRKLCPACRQAQMTSPITSRQLGLEEGTRKRIYKAAGCEECLKTGYKGRTGAFEVIHVTDALRPLIIQRQIEELERLVREQKMPALAEAAAQKVLDGVTSVEEMLKKVILEN